MNVLERMTTSGALAIVRAADQATGQRIADAIVSAGLTCIEVTMTNPGALAIIESLASRSEVCVGVGTVVTTADVSRAKSAGALFVVSPNTDIDVIAATKAAGLVSCPGVATATEVGMALKAGADVLKLFPASSYGPAHLKALRDPYPGTVWCPTGGVSVESVPTWFDAGASFVGLGGPLIKGGAENIGANVHAFMHAIVRAREVKS